jgi:O-antigen/teichoic acid export membrane protein
MFEPRSELRCLKTLQPAAGSAWTRTALHQSAAKRNGNSGSVIALFPVEAGRADHTWSSGETRFCRRWPRKSRGRGTIMSHAARRGAPDASGPHNRLKWNLATNASFTVLNALAGLITLPFLIYHLGPAQYGLWTLIVATAGCFTMLDFGISAAVGRLAADRRSRGDIPGLNVIVSSAFVVLLSMAVAVTGAVAAAIWLFPAIFSVAPPQVADVQLALLLVGIMSSLYFPASAFDGVLWGYERFDLHNAVEIPTLLIRTGLLLALVRSDTTLSEMALIFAGPTVVGYCVRAAICWRLEPLLRIRWQYFSREVVAGIARFGGWLGLLTLMKSTLPNVVTFVVGYALGPVAVTIFTVPRLLVAYANWLLASTTQVIGPRNAVLHFARQDVEQRELFLASSRLSMAFVFYIVGGLALLGDPFLRLWQPALVGPEYAILLILVIGEGLALTQWVTYNLLVAMARHRFLALLATLEIAIVAVASLAVVGRFGLLGIAVVVAVAAVVFRGVLQAAYGLGVLGLSLGVYARRVIRPAVLIGVIPLLSFGLVRILWTPTTWPEFVAGGAIYTVAFGVATWLVEPLAQQALRRKHPVPE